MNAELKSDDINSLKARLADLEAEVRSLTVDGRRGRRRRKQSVDALEAPEMVSRRRVLGMLKGAAAAGAGMAVIGSSNTAFADAVSVGTADGDALQIGGANTNTTLPTGLTGDTGASPFPLFYAHNDAGGGALGGFVSTSTGTGVFGQSPLGAGVIGQASDGVGVQGQSGGGAGMRVADSAEVFTPAPFPTVPMPPTTGTWETGSLVNSAGQLWYCYSAGAGSDSKWVRLSSPFVPVTPTRVYDSRVGAPLPTGILLAGANRTISVADGRNGAGGVSVANLVPAGATAVTANVTVTGTTAGFGYLAINPGGNLVVGASTINWFGAGQTIANGVTLTLNASRELTVICDGASGASTHFIIDVSGYYL